jgi:hypothetical protein
MFDRPEQILSVFFAAMRNGYAKSGVKKDTIAELPGSKTIPFELGDFKLLDCYLVTPDSPHSFGQTIIWRNDVPIWIMSYQGWYLKDAIPFLKRALWEAYDRGDFFGGRGPRFFQNDGMTYTNRFDFPNDWRHFRGREEVFDRNGQNVGWHEYQGLLLVE